MAFARTKIQRPSWRHGARIDRPALEKRLGEAFLTRRLVLLSAAAGFGKTSALVRQCALLPPSTAVAWVSCDADDSPLQLFECLAAALEPFDLPWRTAPEALMRAAADSFRADQRRAVAAELINALDACDAPHGVIVIDDLHRIEHQAVFAFFADLLERLTPRWTLAISTRRELPIPLARLRAQGELAEFRLEDLRFERDEVRSLSAAEGLAAEDADRLFQRTQGWPVGLRLALNAQRQSRFADAQGSAGRIDRNVFDFLADEVIDRLEPVLRDFLLRTSILPELTAARCAALSHDALAALRLEEIEREGLFVSRVGADESTLRLHDLFREALEARFARESPDQFQAALVIAAATEADPIRRVGWLLRAGCWAEAEGVLAEAAEDLIASGFATEVRSLFERFPDDVRKASTRLQMMIAQSRWDWDQAVGATMRAVEALPTKRAERDRLSVLSYRCMALAGANRHLEAHEGIEALLREPGLEGDELARTLAAASWVGVARGDQRQLAPLWSRLNDTLLSGATLSRWNECAPLGPLVGLPGMRIELQRYLRGALPRLPDHPTPLRGKCLVLQGWLHLWAGDVEDAEASVAAASSDARWLAHPVDLEAPWRSLQALLHAIRGRRALATGMLRELIDDIETSGVRFRIQVYLSLYLFMAVRCAALLEADDELRQMASRLSRSGEGRDWLSPKQLASVPAHVAAVDGRLEEACEVWRLMLADQFHGDIYGQMAETRLRLADGILRTEGDIEASACTLQPLFEGLERSREWGAVLLAGPRVLRRLANARWKASLSDVQAGTLRAWADRAETLASSGEKEGDALPANGSPPFALRLAGGQAAAGMPLTGRELEVLSKIAAGDSNKLIARALDVSPHTVKRHVANILDKLGLTSRGQAAAWYQAHR